MQTLNSIRHKLASAPQLALRSTLVRLIPFASLAKNQPPDWLFTSGKPNRYNPAGIQCLYFAEDDASARAEYSAHWAGLAGENQPIVTYYANVRLQNVLDLTSSKTVKVMSIRGSDLFAPWRRAKRPTVTQLIGQAVSESSIVSAIRYPSQAAREAGFAGANIVIFRDCIQPPDSVRILGPTKKELQQWP